MRSPLPPTAGHIDGDVSVILAVGAQCRSSQILAGLAADPQIVW